MLYSSNVNQNINITSVTITTSSAAGLGGVFYFNNAATVYIGSSTFSSFYAPDQGSLMYSDTSKLILTLHSNDIKCVSSAYVYITNLKTNLTSNFN